MVKIIIEDRVFSVHPVYDLYAGSEDGNIINIIKKVPHKGNKNNIMVICVVWSEKAWSTWIQERIIVHRFIWECLSMV